MVIDVLMTLLKIAEMIFWSLASKELGLVFVQVNNLLKNVQKAPHFSLKMIKIDLNGGYSK